MCQEESRAGGGHGGGGIEKREEEEACGDREALSDPPQGKAHGQLHDGSEDGKGGLRASHEMFGDDGHEGRLGDDARQRAEKTEGGLENHGADKERDEGDSHMADGHAGDRGDIERQTKALRELAGDESADDGTDGPAGFDEAEAARTGVEDVVGQRNENDVGADNAGHEQRVG